MLGILALLLFAFLFSWAWAMNQEEKKLSFSEILAVAAVEWGAFLSLLAAHLRPHRDFYEAPPLRDRDITSHQLPIIFVPSLHLGAGVFRFLMWRLRKNFWNSLWLFRWKSFLNDPELLEDQLQTYIATVIERTKASRFRIVSFGTSRPLVSQVLSRPDLAAYCDKWIAVSSPKLLPKSLNFLSLARAKKSYQRFQKEGRDPDLLIVGENDFFCYPTECWGEVKQVILPHVGHFGAALHALCTQNIMRELQQA